MRITSGYRVEILKLHKPLERTLKVCREAVDWLYPVMEKEWEALSEIRMEKQRFNAAEKLIHTTARNKAKYSFDAAFPKMPSYLRRAVLQHVLGAVSSARTRSDNGCPLRNHYIPPGQGQGRSHGMVLAGVWSATTICPFSIRTTCTGRKRTGYI